MLAAFRFQCRAAACGVRGRVRIARNRIAAWIIIVIHIVVLIVIMPISARVLIPIVIAGAIVGEVLRIAFCFEDRLPVLFQVLPLTDATATRTVWSGHVAGLFPVHQRFRLS